MGVDHTIAVLGNKKKKKQKQTSKLHFSAQKFTQMHENELQRR